MAESQLATKKKASKARPGRAAAISPRRAHEVPRVAVSFDIESGRTHQAFRDECDIDKIVDRYARTGIVTHRGRGEPQYGDAPDATLFDAACAQAAIHSAEEEGLEWPPEPPEAAETAPVEQEHREGQEAPQEAAEAASEGHEG